MNSEWKGLIAQEMERETETIMEEVHSDPGLKDVKAPPGLFDEIVEEIREYEKQKVYDQLSEEDREYLRVGKAYMKRRRMNRYVVLVAALVTLFALGTVSIGEKKGIFGFMSRWFASGEQVIVNSDEAEPISYVDENELYEDIEKKYGFAPVKLGYLPEDTVFYEATFSKATQSINMIYEMSDKTSLIYIIRPNYREASFGTVVEDEKMQEYHITVNNVDVMVTEYQILEAGTQKWAVHFIYEDVVYMIRISQMKQEEVERIVTCLEFLQ